MNRVVSFFLIFCSTEAFASGLFSSLADQYDDQRTSITTFIDNDFFTGSDRYYSSGLRVAALTPLLKDNRFSDEYQNFASRLPGLFGDKDALRYRGWAFGHEIYTPRDIFSGEFDPNDRPYAGYLYVSHGLQARTEFSFDHLELSLGVVGDAALGRQFQNTLHTLNGGRLAEGWENQLDNEPTINLYYQKGWRQKITLNPEKEHEASFSQVMAVALGTVETNAEVKFNFRIGKNLPDSFQTLRNSATAYSYNTRYYKQRYAEKGWNFLLGAGAKFKVHDIFLDGGFFRNGQSVVKNNIVFEAEAGIEYRLREWSLSYINVIRTEEFENQDGAQAFAAITLSFDF